MRAPSGMRMFERYDAVLCDLDGVVYRGDQAIDGAPEVLDEVRASGCPVVFLTNNSSRTPDEVASKLQSMGVRADAREVLTSAVATAALLRREGVAPAPGDTGSGEDGGPTAFVIGRRGIRDALEAVGVRIADGAPERTELVVVGWDPDADYDALRTAGLLVQRGARLIGTNPDGSYPAPDGLWPGAGALLAAVVATTGAGPSVVGKPAGPMFEAAAELAGARRPLVIGDRVDTDVAGADAIGWDSMLVFTGAAEPRDLFGQAPLPTYVGPTIHALLAETPRVEIRPATEEELPAAADLVAAAGLPVSSSGAGSRLVLVASAADGIAGTATIFEAAEGWILRAVAVRGDVRSSGLGTLLVASAIRAARERGAGAVFAFTETAERFFAGLGFNRIERDALPEAIRTSEHATGQCSTATAMALALR